jgi:hypothetical protein
MSKNASLTMMRSSAPDLRDADAKRRSAAFWSGTATNVCRSKQGSPVYWPIRRCSSIYAGQRSCGVNGTSTDFTGKQISTRRRPPVKPSIVRTWPADILTIDGQIQKTFHVLIPRWRLTPPTNPVRFSRRCEECLKRPIGRFLTGLRESVVRAQAEGWRISKISSNTSNKTSSRGRSQNTVLRCRPIGRPST